MAVTTTANRDFDVQVLNEVIQGEFAKKSALVGSPLAAAGAIMVDGNMPTPMGARSGWIGQTVTMPYFGILGEFSDNAENSASVPSSLGMTNETASVSRGSMSFEVSRWAQFSGPEDPYLEATRQIRLAAQRYMDDKAIAAAKATPLVRDVFSSSTPNYLDWEQLVNGMALWGDEGNDIAAIVVHSRVEAGLRLLRDANLQPLLVDDMVNGQRVMKFANIPLHVSDKAPLDSSTMSSVTSTGTSPPVATITGTPTGPWNLVIDCTLGGAHQTAKIKFSVDGGNTWSAELTTAASGAPLPLIDTATDSLVGNNGTTGLSVAFAAGTFNADNEWRSNAILKATSLVFQRGAMAFWYASQHMQLLTDKDILKDNDVAAMHIYYACHRYRRRRGGTKPGIVAIKTNVPGFTS